MSKDWSVFAYVGRAISDLEDSEALRTNWATLLDLTLQVSSAVRPLIDDGTPLTDLRIASLHLDYTVQFLRKMPELARSTRYLEILSAELRNATFGAESPLSIEGAKRRGRPRMRVEARHRALIITTGVELLRDFVPDRRVKNAVREMLVICRGVGMNGPRGGQLTEQTMLTWHYREAEGPAAKLLLKWIRDAFPCSTRTEVGILSRRCADVALKLCK